MAQDKKRSGTDRKAPMSDMQAPKALTLSKPSSGSESQSISHPPGHELDLPNTAYTSRRPAAIAASAAIAKAFRDRDESHEPDEEAETTPTKRVKKVGFTKESKAEIFNDSPPTLTPPTFTPSTITPSASSSSPNVKMTEVRARAARHKGQMNFEAESIAPAR